MNSIFKQFFIYIYIWIINIFSSTLKIGLETIFTQIASKFNK